MSKLAEIELKLKNLFKLNIEEAQYLYDLVIEQRDRIYDLEEKIRSYNVRTNNLF